MNTQYNLSQDGFTLIEVMIAIALLVFGILGLYTMQVTAVESNVRANLISTASNANAGQVELLVAQKYRDAVFEDVDGNGTDKDKDWDGIDDTGNNFGLDDDFANADGKPNTQPDGYQIYWNVAVDHPAPNLKTIYMYIQGDNRMMATPIRFVYIKDDIK
ncbi:prepilin-type N-terminal cleavage/methylation domain-containing protein [Desulfogranum japonicum]|uniref:prepilin-type N-terminal cleavage/methylation domain-containing protein n=1 Tax=Desulfogranum japonicum TaxID=231447 RepID=UPI0004101EAD|nr:prepilin-type N-terminal cleavage/methylation domain-containing protein [Desulfogranum japonicum]